MLRLISISIISYLTGLFKEFKSYHVSSVFDISIIFDAEEFLSLPRKATDWLVTPCEQGRKIYCYKKTLFYIEIEMLKQAQTHEVLNTSEFIENEVLNVYMLFELLNKTKGL